MPPHLVATHRAATKRAELMLLVFDHLGPITLQTKPCISRRNRTLLAQFRVFQYDFYLIVASTSWSDVSFTGVLAQTNNTQLSNPGVLLLLSRGDRLVLL